MIYFKFLDERVTVTRVEPNGKTASDNLEPIKGLL